MISRPTTKKNKAISRSFTQWRRSSVTGPSVSSVCHRSSYAGDHGDDDPEVGAAQPHGGWQRAPGEGHEEAEHEGQQQGVHDLDADVECYEVGPDQHQDRAGDDTQGVDAVEALEEGETVCETKYNINKRSAYR